MKSLTIHNIDEKLYKLLHKRSIEEGRSLNKTIKLILRESLGLSPLEPGKKNDFSEFSGVWSKTDEKVFLKNMEDLNKVDPKDW